MLLSLPGFKSENCESLAFIDFRSHFSLIILVDSVVPVGASRSSEENSKQQLFIHATKAAIVTRG